MENAICIVGPCLKMGGMERASANFANALHREKIQVSYVSIFKTNKFFSLDEGIDFIEPLDFNVSNLSIIKTMRYLRHFAKNSQVDTFIVINKLYSALTVLALAGLKKKIFISERSSPLYKWPIAQEFFIRMVFSLFKPSGIIAQTKIAATFQSKYYGKNIPIKVIHNVLRPIKYYPEVQKENIILAVGRLGDYLKGFDRLIDAFSLIQSKKWSLVFVGGERGEGGLFEKVVALGLQDKVIFAGAERDVDLWYARASIFVIPSRSEGFPNVLAEAMGAGMACVSFDFVAGPVELINSGVNGVLVENGNIQALANAIEDLMENPLKIEKLGKEAMKVTESLDERVITKQIIDFVF